MAPAATIKDFANRTGFDGNFLGKHVPFHAGTKSANVEAILLAYRQLLAYRHFFRVDARRGSGSTTRNDVQQRMLKPRGLSGAGVKVVKNCARRFLRCAYVWAVPCCLELHKGAVFQVLVQVGAHLGRG